MDTDSGGMRACAGGGSRQGDINGGKGRHMFTFNNKEIF